MTLSPRYYRDYKLSSDCVPEFTLTEMVVTQDWRDAFDNPAIETYILTAYDGTTFGGCETQRFLDPAFYIPETLRRSPASTAT